LDYFHPLQLYSRAYRARLALPPQSLLPSPPLACRAPDREGHTRSCTAPFSILHSTITHSLSQSSLSSALISVWTRFRLLPDPGEDIHQHSHADRQSPTRGFLPSAARGWRQSQRFRRSLPCRLTPPPLPLACLNSPCETGQQMPTTMLRPPRLHTLPRLVTEAPAILHDHPARAAV
jgi:hypothetical protein